jgi:hypothetical protein
MSRRAASGQRFDAPSELFLAAYRTRLRFDRRGVAGGAHFDRDPLALPDGVDRDRRVERRTGESERLRSDGTPDRVNPPAASTGAVNSVPTTCTVVPSALKVEALPPLLKTPVISAPVVSAGPSAGLDGLDGAAGDGLFSPQAAIINTQGTEQFEPANACVPFLGELIANRYAERSPAANSAGHDLGRFDLASRDRRTAALTVETVSKCTARRARSV